MFGMFDFFFCSCDCMNLVNVAFFCHVPLWLKLHFHVHAGQLSEDKQKQYEQLILSAKNGFEVQREIAEGLKLELSDLRKRYEEKNLEVKAISIKLQTEQGCNQWKADEERKRSAEKMQKLLMELETLKAQYEEEKKRSTDLLYQVSILLDLILFCSVL